MPIVWSSSFITAGPGGKLTYLDPKSWPNEAHRTSSIELTLIFNIDLVISYCLIYRITTPICYVFFSSRHILRCQSRIAQLSATVLLLVSLFTQCETTKSLAQTTLDRSNLSSVIWTISGWTAMLTAITLKLSSGAYNQGLQVDSKYTVFYLDTMKIKMKDFRVFFICLFN